MAKDANAGSAWWLRIRYVPDDFWGLVPNMEITKQPPEPAEGSFRSDGIAIKYLREDYPLIQGGQINWVAWAGHESLELSSPNRTPENKKVAEERETEGQIRALTEQLLANPKAAVKFFYRARGWKKKREYAKALSDYNAAIRLQPGDPFYLFERGELQCKLLSFESGIRDLSEAIKYMSLGPAELDSEVEWKGRMSEWNAALAWVYATCPEKRFRNASKAVELATRACDLDKWESERGLRTLAAACAENGDFAAAIKWQNAACKIVPKEVRAKEELALKEYQAGHPRREDFSNWESPRF